MHLVLATIVTMTQGLAHNVESFLPTPAHPAATSVGPGGAPPYDEAYSHCLRRPSGATVCRRTLRPAG